VAWALFLAKALSIKLPKDVVEPITDLESSVCALLTLDLRSRLLIDGPIDTSIWQQNMNAAGLRSNNWLLAYEAEIKGWLPAQTANFVDDDPRFSVLKKHGVSFYDIKKNVKHIKSGKPKQISSALAKYLEITSGEGFHMPIENISLIG
jgi:hypothetical protein